MSVYVASDLGGVGILQIRLGAKYTHLAQKSEKLKEDGGKGGAAADSDAALYKEVNQQLSDNVCKL